MSTQSLFYTPFDPTEKRAFGNATLDAAVRSALEKRGPDDTWAFIGIADGRGARTAVAIKAGDHWSFGGYLEKPWHGPLEYGVEVIASG